MRISDWSSDVCSSDLFSAAPGIRVNGNRQYDELDNKSLRASILFDPTSTVRNITVFDYFKTKGAANIVFAGLFPGATPVYALPSSVLDSVGLGTLLNQIGRASCRERVCQYV